MKIAAEAISNRLELPQILLFKHYKKVTPPFFQKIDKIYSKKVTKSTLKKLFKRRFFYFEKHPKLKFFGCELF